MPANKGSDKEDNVPSEDSDITRKNKESTERLKRKKSTLDKTKKKHIGEGLQSTAPISDDQRAIYEKKIESIDNKLVQARKVAALEKDKSDDLIKQLRNTIVEKENKLRLAMEEARKMLYEKDKEHGFTITQMVC